MREIKFRVFFANYPNPEFRMAYGINFYDPLSMPANLLRTTPLMQYTGLKDKNGEEIYEGDIVKEPDGDIAEIRWIRGKFMAYYDDGVPLHIRNHEYEHFWEELEVIGNIHENPELLKNK